MSAFLCTPAHIAVIAQAATKTQGRLDIYIEGRGWVAHSAAEVAAELMRENIRSVNHRYRDKQDKTAEALYVAAAMREAELPQANWAVVALLKLCNSLAYQSCETEDWETTLAFKMLAATKEKLIRELPGYDDAEWLI